MKADRWILRILFLEGGNGRGDNNFVAETALN